MKAVVQRVLKANLKVGNELVSEIDNGLLVFFGVGTGDGEIEAQKLVNKIVKLRIFEDENQKMNLSIKDIGGQILLVSQFTLYADCRHGNRPSFITAEKPERANELYELAKQMFINESIDVKTGIFGADMKITAINDGPVTIIIDSNDLK